MEGEFQAPGGRTVRLDLQLYRSGLSGGFDSAVGLAHPDRLRDPSAYKVWFRIRLRRP